MENEMKICACTNRCKACKETEAQREITRLNRVILEAGDFGYRMGYVVGAADYGGITLYPENVEVPEGKWYE